MLSGQAADALEIAKKQFQVGGISYVSVLNAQRLFLQARQSRVQAQAARYADSRHYSRRWGRLVESQGSRGSQAVSSVVARKQWKRPETGG